jgi:hypothetical protein
MIAHLDEDAQYGARGGHFSKGRGLEQRVTNAPGMRTLCFSAAIILNPSVHSILNFFLIEVTTVLG